MNEVFDRLFVAVVLRDHLIGADQLDEAFQRLCARPQRDAAHTLVAGGYLSRSEQLSVAHVVTERLHELADRLIEGRHDDATTALWNRWIAARSGRNSGSAPADFGGRYEISELQGEGAHGRVWRAQDTAIGRLVAVKELKPDKETAPDARARFVHEARVTGQLEHPCIVPVYELHDSGSVFYTMRLVSGQTMQEAIEELHAAPTLPRARLWRLLEAFLHVCGAVGFAHTRGIVHRDLKPANIVLGSFGEVCVLDWGMARRIGQRDQAERSTSDDLTFDQTHTGHILGTPRYMAPEQAAGHNERIDGRTDVYALGAILFAILTGQSPHDRFKSLGRDEYLQNICQGNIPRAAALKASVPAALDAVCARALATAPAARYAQALDLADDVRQWLHGEPTSVYREPWLQRLRRTAMQHRRLTMTGAAALITLVVAATAFSVQSWAETNSLVELSMRELRTRADMIRNEILIHVHHLELTCASTSANRSVQELVRQPGGGGASTRQEVAELFSMYLRFVVLTRSLSIVDDSAAGQELVRVLRRGPVEAPVNAPAAELRKLGTIGKYEWLFEPASRSARARVGFCQGQHGEPGMSLVLATPIDQPGHRYWLLLEYDFTTWLTILLDPFAYHRIQAFVRDEQGRLLVNAGAQHADSQFGNAEVSGDVRLQQFLSQPGYVQPRPPLGTGVFLRGVPPADPRNALELTDCGPDRDLVFASKVHYNPERQQSFLSLILVEHPDDVLAHRRIGRLVMFGLWLLIFTAAMAMAVLAARLFTRREAWQS